MASLYLEKSDLVKRQYNVSDKTILYIAFISDKKLTNTPVMPLDYLCLTDFLRDQGSCISLLFFFFFLAKLYYEKYSIGIENVKTMSI